jgi:hypothetical protein
LTFESFSEVQGLVRDDEEAIKGDEDEGGIELKDTKARTAWSKLITNPDEEFKLLLKETKS